MNKIRSLKIRLSTLETWVLELGGKKGLENTLGLKVTSRYQLRFYHLIAV